MFPAREPQPEQLGTDYGFAVRWDTASIAIPPSENSDIRLAPPVLQILGRHAGEILHHAGMTDL
jgi:hypothetical protein